MSKNCSVNIVRGINVERMTIRDDVALFFTRIRLIIGRNRLLRLHAQGLTGEKFGLSKSLLPVSSLNIVAIVSRNRDRAIGTVAEQSQTRIRTLCNCNMRNAKRTRRGD